MSNYLWTQRKREREREKSLDRVILFVGFSLHQSCYETRRRKHMSRCPRGRKCRCESELQAGRPHSAMLVRLRVSCPCKEAVGTHLCSMFLDEEL